MDNTAYISSSPHIRGSRTTSKIMLDVIIALLPASVAGVIIFGLRSLAVIAVCVMSAVVGEYVFQKAAKKQVLIGDLSACVTGLLLALNLPVSIPLWQAALGSLFAVVAVKGLFGGIGQNFANPAITARIMLVISFSGTMTNWTAPVVTDLASSATPLAVMKEGMEGLPQIKELLLGVRAGSLGESCVIAILAGGIYLLARGVIKLYAPLSYIGTVFVLGLLFGGIQFALYQILSGGLMLGAFFMATDYSTTPITSKGKVVFGIGCGLITCAIRFYGSYPEGVSFAILLMNIVTPYIDKLCFPKAIGGAKK